MDIYVKGNLTRQDIIKAFFRHLKPNKNSISVRAILIGLMVLVLVFAQKQVSTAWWTYPLTLIAIAGVLAPWWLPYFQGLTYDRNSPLLKPLTGTVTNEGVSLRGYHFNSDMKWTSFTYFKKTNDIVLLYQGPNAFNFLSRSLFKSEAEWEECISLISKFLPSN